VLSVEQTESSGGGYLPGLFRSLIVYYFVFVTDVDLTSIGLHLCFDITLWTRKTCFTIPRHRHALSDVKNSSHLLG